MATRVPSCLHTSDSVLDDLHDIESLIYEIGDGNDNLMQTIALKLLSEVRRLQHELNDPRYNYVGRIPRTAILYRDDKIDRLNKELTKLRAINKELCNASKTDSTEAPGERETQRGSGQDQADGGGRQR